MLYVIWVSTVPGFDNWMEKLHRNQKNHQRENNHSHVFSLTSDSKQNEINQTIDGLLNCIDEITAVFVTSDRLAASIMSGLYQHGIHIPEDLSIIGFDNTLVSTQTFPQLTTIEQDLNIKAKLAVDILNSRLQNPESFAESRIIDVTLVQRNQAEVHPCHNTPSVLLIWSSQANQYHLHIIRSVLDTSPVCLSAGHIQFLILCYRQYIHPH